MSDLNINNITDRTGDSGPVIAGVSTVSSTGAFVVPVGPTEMRGGRGRGVMLNMTNPSATTNNDFITIATTGNSQSFGDQGLARYSKAGFASATRGFDAGGSTPTLQTKIEYVTISSEGGGYDFGDLTVARSYPAGASNATRGIIAAGSVNPTPGTQTNSIEFVTMASTGDASEFGDLTLSRTYMSGAGCQSTTRGIFAGGHPMNTNIIDFVLFSTKGTATKFGELTLARSGISAGSNATRGIFAGGSDGVTNSGVNTIDFITMATEGNATDFGDATTASFRWMGAGMYSATRGVHCGGYPAINTIQYITVASTGNAQDFGDATQNIGNSANSSDSHGGLG
tara:strand:- start:1438 stop:2460 length:1023 start_codon:yes stop_codon:yes gene_type:complete